MTTNRQPTMLSLSRGLTLALCSALLAASPAQAGLLDNLFGQSSAGTTKASPHQRLWAIREFTQVQLVEREAGSAENQQPVQLPIEALRQQLAQIEVVGRNGRMSLFTADELADIVPPLVQALGVAGPGDDALLLSSSRREGGILGSPTAITARFFVQGGSLNMIVHDARKEFYDLYRGTHVAPEFAYGSRDGAAATVLQSASASNRRSDWLAIPLQGASPNAAAAVAPPVLLAPMPTTRPAIAPGATPSAVPAAVPAPAPRKPLDNAGADDIERRLETLKRLRDKGLITEDEYQQKRKEILQLL